jgi:hypothetical protein
MDTTVRFVSDFLYTQLDCATGISSVTTNQVIVYPNPAKDIVYIQTNLQTPYIFRLLSVDGKEVVSGSSTYEVQNSISIENMPEGLYIIELQNTQKTIRSKILKIKD